MKWNKDLIIVKDNFFNKTLFKEIYADLDKVKFVNRFTKIKANKQRIYFDVLLGRDHPGCIALKSFFKNELGVLVKKLDSSYFLSTKYEEPFPHTDAAKINCIIYLKGGSLINNGTALYEKNNEGVDVINSHIGFKENRAVVFSGRTHASLQFAEGSTARFIMANFIEDYELE